MKKRKWILPVSIVGGVIVLCIVAVFAFGAILSAQGYGISTGRLYFADNGTYLIDSDDMAMRVSDCSDDAELFKGYQNGDKVILFHDGVNETYPAQTGGYYIIRTSKGDGTYKPADEILGIQELGSDGYLLAAQKVDFDVQYIRTGAQNYEGPFPAVAVIHSTDELTAYYEANKEQFYLERREDPGSDSTIGFLDACDKYDTAYFEKQVLVVVLLEEGSGSIRHKVESMVMSEDGKCHISIDRIVPEAGTCDMAGWHILIEPAAGTAVTEADIAVYIDGINPLTQDKQAQHARGYANMFLDIPQGWEYETDSAEGSNNFCISFWPSGKAEGKISVWYHEAFGVCGTGLKEEKITIAGYEAYKGTYDNKKVWDFISLIGTPGKYVIMNEGASAWWNEYGDEAMQILETLKVADGILGEAEVINLVKKDVTVEYNQVKSDFDIETGIWTVCFYTRNVVGGDQTFTVTHEGKVIDVEYGE